jgi:hypothetical protein
VQAAGAEAETVHVDSVECSPLESNGIPGELCIDTKGVQHITLGRNIKVIFHHKTCQTFTALTGEVLLSFCEHRHQLSIVKAGLEHVRKELAKGVFIADGRVCQLRVSLHVANGSVRHSVDSFTCEPV